MLALTEFLAARYAEDWSAARDRGLTAGTDSSRGTRDIDAKREIVAKYASAQVHGRGMPGYVNRTMDLVVRLLAAVYSDHPDYREEWGP